MELVVQLPPNYPLDQPSVSVSQRVGIPEKNWRRWMLQLTVFLAHQVNRILIKVVRFRGCSAIAVKHVELGACGFRYFAEIH